MTALHGRLSLSTVRATSLLLLLLLGCDQPQTEAARARRVRAPSSRTDTVIPPDRTIPFQVPASWETVKLASGVQYQQPPGFALGLNDNMVGGCNAQTYPVDSAVLHTAFSSRWPLTLAMRRGDLNRLALANGFVLDSTIIAIAGQRDPDSTHIRRGEGWVLLGGHTWIRNDPVNVLFGALRYPGGCYLTLAARGVEINIDTLGYVLGTVKFPAGAP